ncbi:S41 family peptidase [Brevundimonas goettingensis]|uniref:Tail specific protease domain-containing protein n=1 Tax=Brevundimonas goettingensis TaxID=2774190 RepID=A0A975GVM7_9CAUL|nr:S41 family peptidase [Brevundimonas goettingensis]QTC91616.1 hypothetical protein IFJ75_01370 [Brevundimonas goettingensis]
MRAFTTVLLLLAASPVPALAQTPAPGPAAGSAPAPAVTARSPRETVQAVATRIRDLYFDPRRADEIAKGLEDAAAAGEFDAQTDPRDLATALTVRLRPLDGHFNVVFDPRLGDGPPMRGPGPQAGPRPGPRPANPAEARGHYGFRGVQILPGNIGYIDLRQFSEIDFNDPKDPARAAADAALSFVGGTDAVIFDLRDNGGGAPSMVGYLTSAFTPANAPIYNIFHSREGTESEAPEVYHADPRLTVPVYILTSARTGSAGEAFPYTLQAARRAVIVGEASGGAANPGGMVPAGGGFAVFVSMGSPVNPITGGNWEGAGVKPDVAVSWDKALDTAQTLALEKIIAADGGRTDAVWALEALRSQDLPAEVAGNLGDYTGTYGDRTISVEGGRLKVVAGRRPPVTLAPLGDDLFTIVGDPGRRYQFLRGDDGKVMGLEAVGVGGAPQRIRRTA